ncbi:uncharacterized protein RHOBADRAFT_52131 [Rhodotorula graminis WP1]|uniref:Uncharacterized protein n=1 Tax=Rhodotorula graminis (strain WP1) TaxID=578459 RepID=A0A194S9P8_RHOGW|nr:uncharacterized protein RHOBADRAFT_52131 [Rhodotorula graminis WP1]KPV77190.1 hypothetical protein RHOBADRAFT_52131 [Rhodotorula graminis WP1]
MQVHTSTHPSPASDLVTCALFSPLATHLALASADHHVRVTTQHPDSHTWDHNPREWKAHDGPVLALAWAHPSFGNLLASGGSDGALHLWLDDHHDQHHHDHSHSHSHGRPPPGWTCTASLLDAHGTLRSLSFAPPEAGLKLAAVSSDSHLRVWECLDPLNLRDWQLRDDVDLAALPLSPSSAAPLHGAHGELRPGTAGALVGSGDGFGLASGVSAASGASSAGVGASSSAGSTAAPFPSVSSASSVSGTGTGTGGAGGAGGARAGGTVESDGAWAVSWCQEAWWGERIAVSSGTNGLIRLFHFPSSSSSSSSSAPWHNYLNLLPSRPFITSRAPSSTSSAQPASTPTSSAFSVPGTGTSSTSSDDPDAPHHGPGSHTHTPPTASLAWAPPSGRSFLLLAAGARDGRARVWKVVPPPLGAPSSAFGSAATDTRSSAATGAAAQDEGGAGAAGEWAARLEVELDAAPPAERPGLAVGGGSGGAGAAGGPGGALASARVAWNVTGTVLSTSGGDDGRVRLWKPTYTGQWRQLAVLGTEDTPGAT